MGEIKALMVVIEGDDDWFVEKLEVIDTKRTTVTVFPCTCWLDRGVNAQDKSTQSRLLYPGTVDGLQSQSESHNRDVIDIRTKFPREVLIASKVL